MSKLIQKILLVFCLTFLASHLIIETGPLFVKAQDLTEPVISIISPTNKAYSTKSIELSYTIDEKVSWIGYSLDGNGNQTIEGNVTLSELSEGPHTIVVFATDLSENTGKTEMINFSVDTVPPTITILSPTATTYSTNNVNLNFTVDEQVSWTGYSLDEEENITSGNMILSSLSEGDHTIVVFSTDQAGNTGKSDSISFEVSIPPPDTEDPMITILSPKPITYPTNDVELAFTINEEVSLIEYSLDGAENQEISGNTTLTLSEGHHKIVVYATDLAGNTGKSNPVNFNIVIPTSDTEPPTITISSPESKSYSTNNVDLTFIVDEEVLWTAYSLDGAENETIGNTTLLSLSEGVHTIVVYATDLAGNTGKSDTIIFEISVPQQDTEPPTITIFSPTSTSYSINNVDLKFTVDEEVSWMGYSLDGAENQTSGNTTLSSLSEGAHTIVVYATDQAGNTGKSSTIYFEISILLPDTDPPTITILSPTFTTYLNQDVELTFIVDEEASWIGYSLDGASNQTILGDTILALLSEGSHNLVVYATDLAANTGKSNVVFFEVSVPPLDMDIPRITVVSPQNFTYSSSNVPINLIINEETSWIGYSVDGKENVTVYGNYTIWALSDGVHSLVVYATDLSGNTGKTEMINFSVDTVPPVVIIWPPGNQTYPTSDLDVSFVYNEELSWIVYSLDGADNKTITGNFTLWSLSDGPHNIVIYSADKANNTDRSNIVFFSIDTTLPVVQLLAPANVTYTADAVDVNFKVKEDVSWIGYSLDGASNRTVDGNFTLSFLSDGSHNVVVYVLDAKKVNFGKASVFFTVDTAPPVLVINSPVNNGTYTDSNNVTLSFSVDEEAVLKYSLDGQANVTVVNSTVLYNLSNGEHNLTVYSEDLHGNKASSVTIVFEVDFERILRPLEIVAVSVIIVAAISFIIINGYKSKR